MMYLSSPTSLAYSELNFISTSVKHAAAPMSVDAIFDEVAREIQTLFIGEVIEAPSVPALGLSVENFWFGSEVAN